MMPREKLLHLGARSLSDHELLAIFLRTETKNIPVLHLSQRLLHEFGSLYNLMNATEQEFCQKVGLGIVKYTQLQAVIELSQRYLAVKMTKDNCLNSPDTTYHYLSGHLAQQ